MQKSAAALSKNPRLGRTRNVATIRGSAKRCTVRKSKRLPCETIPANTTSAMTSVPNAECSPKDPAYKEGSFSPNAKANKAMSSTGFQGNEQPPNTGHGSSDSLNDRNPARKQRSDAIGNISMAANSHGWRNPRHT